MTACRRATLPLLLALALFGAMLTPSAAAEARLTLTRMELDIAVDYGTPGLSGNARLTVQNDGDAPEDSIPLLLNRLMRFTAARSADGDLGLAWSTDAVVVRRVDSFSELLRSRGLLRNNPGIH